MPTKPTKTKKREYLANLNFQSRNVEQRGEAWERKMDDLLRDPSRDTRNPEVAKINNLLLEAWELLEENRKLMKKYQSLQK